MSIIFSEFRWYRKIKGGTWHKINCWDLSGWSSGHTFWQREEPNEFQELIKTECYK
jgi:hypothetical protein